LLDGTSDAAECDFCDEALSESRMRLSVLEKETDGWLLGQKTLSLLFKKANAFINITGKLLCKLSKDVNIKPCIYVS
jgi:hypothetical protein